MNSKGKTFQKKVKANDKHNGHLNLEEEADNVKAGVDTVLETSLPKRGETDCGLQQPCVAAVEGNCGRDKH